MKASFLLLPLLALLLAVWVAADGVADNNGSGASSRSRPLLSNAQGTAPSGTYRVDAGH